MTEDHDHDTTASAPIERIEPLQDVTPDDPLETAVSTATEGAKPGTLPLVGGGVFLVSALRAVASGRLRAIPYGLAGIGLVRYGLDRRRSSEDEQPFESSLEDVEGSTAGKETSDEAATATGGAEGREIDETGDLPDAAVPDDADDEGGSRVQFTTDEPGDREATRATPDLDEGAGDPRRTDEDEVEVDLSQSAMAEEASEAAGPSHEQAQPTQTDATEPEETPEDDASHMKVEPDEADSRESGAEMGDDEGEADDAKSDENESGENEA